MTTTTSDYITKYFSNEDEWVSNRRFSVGASELPSIVGECYENESALGTYASKVNGSDKKTVTEQMLLGRDIEPGIRAAFKRKAPEYQAVYEKGFFQYVSKARPHASCTTDGGVYDSIGDYGVLEFKYEFALPRDDNGKPVVALRHQIQIQQQMYVTGTQYGVLYQIVGGNRFSVVTRIERDDELISLLQKELDAFWQCVIDKVEPPAGPKFVDARVLARLHPDDNGQILELPDSIAATVDSLRDIKAEAKNLEEQEALCENKIKQYLGDNTFGRLPDGSLVSWKTIEFDRKPSEAKHVKFRKLNLKAKVK